MSYQMNTAEPLPACEIARSVPAWMTDSDPCDDGRAGGSA